MKHGVIICDKDDVAIGFLLTFDKELIYNLYCDRYPYIKIYYAGGDGGLIFYDHIEALL